MTETTQLKSPSKYHQDFVVWCEDTVAKLKDRDIEGLDFEALIEEIESLGLRDKRELKSRLGVLLAHLLLAHLLKRLYVQSPNDYCGWQNAIADQRREIELLIEQSPSLKNYFVEVFEDSWRHALKRVKQDYPTVQLPDEWEFSRDLDAILTEDFWLTDEDGEKK
ncbi:DUF29 domain-containing protein [Leptolyngbyaceae cyanobacterium UHCC 1019]